jgi:DNA repair exonuclease SbcCD nuclease subunit
MKGDHREEPPMLRLLHTSDWQLGMTRHFLNADAQPRFDQERIDAVIKIAALAENERCDLVVVAGDIFESNYLDRSYLLRCLEALRHFRTPIVLVPGNHDPNDPSSIYRSKEFQLLASPFVTVARDETPLHFQNLDCTVYPAPWPAKRVTSNLVLEACQRVDPTAARYRIVVGHGAVDTLVPSFGNPAAIRLQDVEPFLSERAVHYVALGDRHSRTQVDNGGRCWYSGTPVVTDFDETAPNSVLLVELEPHGPPSVRHLQTSEWRFSDLAFEFVDQDSVERFHEGLAALDHKHETVLRLSLTGTLGLSESLRLEEIIERTQPLFAALFRWDRHSNLTVLPSDLTAAQLDLHGYAARALEALVSETTSTTESASTALDALALLYRLSGELL